MIAEQFRTNLFSENFALWSYCYNGAYLFNEEYAFRDYSTVLYDIIGKDRRRLYTRFLSSESLLWTLSRSGLISDNPLFFLIPFGCSHEHCKVCFEARKIKFVSQNPCNAQCCDSSEVVITESISEDSNLDYLNNLYSLKRKLPRLMRIHRSG